MSRRYDSKTNTFTQEGRLLQVEYAMKAIENAGSAVGVLTRDGIVLTTERQDAQFLLEQSKDSEKIYCLDKHLYCVVGGVTADANYLIDVAREELLGHRYKYRDNMPIEQCVIYICDLKQSYTHFGGKRPFGTSFMFAGYDKNHKYQLYSTDPSGNYAGWKAQAIGHNYLTASSFLKQEYKDDLTLDQGIDLATKALIKTMDTAKPNPSKIEILVITKDDKGEVNGKSLTVAEIEQVLKRSGFTVDKMEIE